MSHKSREPATVKGNSSKPQHGAQRPLEKLAETEAATAQMSKTDVDRHKEVRKAQHGSLRVCPSCGAVSERKRWLFDPAKQAEAKRSGRAIEPTLCPGCARVNQGRVDGFVELRGPAIAKAPHEIKRLIDHVLAEARANDPVHQIVSYTVMEDRIALETTSQWLAETIGKAVNRQLRGELQIKFIPDEEFVRVYWQQS